MLRRWQTSARTSDIWKNIAGGMKYSIALQNSQANTNKYYGI
jgi:hypothetical protein